MERSKINSNTRYEKHWVKLLCLHRLHTEYVFTGSPHRRWNMSDWHDIACDFSSSYLITFCVWSLEHKSFPFAGSIAEAVYHWGSFSLSARINGLTVNSFPIMCNLLLRVGHGVGECPESSKLMSMSAQPCHGELPGQSLPHSVRLEGLFCHLCQMPILGCWKKLW